MEECKSSQAEALAAAAVRGPNQAASDATRVEAEAYAAVAAVQAGVDACRAEALAASHLGPVALTLFPYTLRVQVVAYTASTAVVQQQRTPYCTTLPYLSCWLHRLRLSYVLVT